MLYDDTFIYDVVIIIKRESDVSFLLRNILLYNQHDILTSFLKMFQHGLPNLIRAKAAHLATQFTVNNRRRQQPDGTFLPDHDPVRDLLLAMADQQHIQTRGAAAGNAARRQALHGNGDYDFFAAGAQKDRIDIDDFNLTNSLQAARANLAHGVVAPPVSVVSHPSYDDILGMSETQAGQRLIAKFGPQKGQELVTYLQAQNVSKRAALVFTEFPRVKRLAAFLYATHSGKNQTEFNDPKINALNVLKLFQTPGNPTGTHIDPAYFDIVHDPLIDPPPGLDLPKPILYTLRDLQDPGIIALLLKCIYWIACEAEAHPAGQEAADLEVLARITLYTRRTYGEGNQGPEQGVTIHRFTIPFIGHGNAAQPNLGHQLEAYRIDGATSVSDLASTIYKDIFDVLSRGLNSGMGGIQNSTFVDIDNDSYVILNIGIRIAKPHDPHGVYFFTNALANTQPGHIELAYLLKSLKAFKIPKTLFYTFERLSVKCPPSNYDNYCIFESFLLIRMTELHPELQYRKEKLEWMEPHLQSLKSRCTAEEACCLFSALSTCLQYDLEHFTDSQSVNEIDLAFFRSFGVPCPIPSVTIKWSEELGDLEFNILHNESEYYQTHSGEGEPLIMVYHGGHILTSTWSLFYKASEQKGALTERIRDSTLQEPPAPFELSPVLNIAERQVKRQQAWHKDQTKTRTGDHLILSTVMGDVYDVLWNINKFSADLETGHCDECSMQTGKDEQDAFACAVAWGSLPHEHIVFVGHECAALAKRSNFETYDGCITQMLRWMKRELGFYDRPKESSHPPTHIINRWIYFANGSRFDHFFLWKCLLGWNESIQILPMDGALLQIKWGQYTFVDFFRIYRGSSLEALFDLFATSNHDLHQKPAKSKWKCFPYNAICSQNWHQRLTLEEMKRDDLWGGKKANIDDPRSIGEVNTEWWSTTISDQGYDPAIHLGDYCLWDVIILQYCVRVDCFYLSKGIKNGRSFNTNNCITGSDRSMKMFKHAFLEHSIESPDLKTKTYIIDPQHDTPISLSDVFDQAYQGGKVDLMRHDMINAERQPLWEEHIKAGGKHLGDDMDVNSMYPYVMHHYEMPVALVKVENYQTEEEGEHELTMDTLIDQNLYWCRIAYPQGESGILSKCAGYSVAVSEIAYCYVDPHRNNTRFTFVYGVELRQAMRQGAKVHARVCFVFRTAPLYKTFVEVIYNERVAATSKLEKTNLKNLLNEQYGKYGQGRKAGADIIYNEIDMDPVCRNKWLVDIKEIPGTYTTNTPMWLLSTIDPEKSHIGQFNFIAAMVTAAARAHLCFLIQEISKCKNAIGLPVDVYYSDTDSIKADMIDRTLPESQTFFETWVHQSRLGALKSETDYAGFDFAVFLRKKTNLVHYLTDTSTTVETCPVEEMPNSEFEIRTKGLPHRIVLPQDLYDIYKGKPRVVYKMPTQFVRSIQGGISKLEDSTRSLTMGNATRKLPDSNGYLKPHASIDDFVASFGL